MNRNTARHLIAKDMRNQGATDIEPADVDHILTETGLHVGNLPGMVKDYGTDTKTVEAYRTLLEA